MGLDLIDQITLSFMNLWADVMSFLPALVVALIVILVGWVLGSFVKTLIVSIFRTLNVNKLLESAGADDLVRRTGYPLKAGEFVGSLVKWFVILVFFVAALEILRLEQVTVFLREVVLGYLPNVIVAVLILLIASIVAQVISSSVVATARAAGFRSANLLGGVARYAVIVFAALAALNQLQIAPELVQTLFMGIVFAASLAFGLAFGLGGREAASRYIEEISRK
ncbi:MAG: hypothetical protein WD605_00435 [Candidatus Paceibacterota bacterium]